MKRRERLSELIGKDGVSMGDVFDNFTVDMLSELHRSLSSAGRAHPSTLAGEGDKERVLAAIAVFGVRTPTISLRDSAQRLGI